MFNNELSICVLHNSGYNTNETTPSRYCVMSTIVSWALLCHEHYCVVSMHVVPRKHFFQDFFSNSEAFRITKKSWKMFPWYWWYIDNVSINCIDQKAMYDASRSWIVSEISWGKKECLRGKLFIICITKIFLKNIYISTIQYYYYFDDNSIFWFIYIYSTV